MYVQYNSLDLHSYVCQNKKTHNKKVVWYDEPKLRLKENFKRSPVYKYFCKIHLETYKHEHEIDPKRSTKLGINRRDGFATSIHIFLISYTTYLESVHDFIDQSGLS